MDEINRLLQRIADLTTADYFPAIYNGFVEADALVQGENSLLGLIREYVIQLWQNRNLLSMTEEKTAEFENRLHITPSASQTLDDRRQTVADAINERFVLNDATLHEICQGLAPDFTVYEKTDPQELTLGVFTTEDGEDGELPAVGIVDTIRPTVPQNLALYAGVETHFERVAVISHASFSALKAGLGKVQRKAPEPNVIVVDDTGKIIGGILDNVTCESLGVLTTPHEGVISIELETVGLTEPEPVIVDETEPPEPDYIDVILAMKYNTSTGQFVANASSANDWWWSCVRNQEDKDRLTAFGVRVGDPRSSSSGTQTGFCGPYGCINDSASNPEFSYEVLGVYSDIDGTTPISQAVSNFYTGRSSSWPEVIVIWNIATTPSYMTWKCRITKNT